MNKRRDQKSSSPHGVAALASMMVLVVGVGVSAYFVEFRGTGLQTLMSGIHAQEILALFGGLAVCTLVTQFMVASAVRKPASQENVRDMVRAVLDLDPSDPNAMRPLQSVPELHELAIMIAAEKSAKIEAIQQLQTQRREIAGLLKGMERSAVTRDPLREEPGSEACNQVTRFWNAMLLNKPVTASAPDSEAPTMQGPGSPEPGMVNLDDAAPLSVPFVGDELVRRVERVEDSLETLEHTVRQLSQAPTATQTALPSIESPASTASSLFAPEPEEEDRLVLDTSVPETSRPVELGAVSESALEPESTSSPSAYHEWNGTQMPSGAASTSQADGVETPLPGLESSGFHEAPALPGTGHGLPTTGSAPAFDKASMSTPTGGSIPTPSPHEPGPAPFATERPQPQSDPSTRQPSTAPSFGAAPSQGGPSATPNVDVSFGAAPTPPPVTDATLPGTQRPSADPSKATKPQDDVDREFANLFPHFVGQPVAGNDPQIEVTYGADPQTAKPAPTRAPAPARAPEPTRAPQPARPQTPRATQPSAPSVGKATPVPAAPAAANNPRQFPESQIIDLRSLGAVEFED